MVEIHTTLIEPPYVVICSDGDQGGFDGFIHEADLMLGVLVQAGIDDDDMDEVRAELEGYGDLLQDAIQQADEDGTFPAPFAGYDYFPATASFIADVSDLRVPGVVLDPSMGRPMSYAIERLWIEDEQALQEVVTRLKGRYTIMPLAASEWAWAISVVAGARTIIQHARASQPTSP